MSWLGEAWTLHVHNVLHGVQHLDDVPDHHRGPVRHLLKMPVYQRAVSVLERAQYDPEAIKSALASYPDTVRDLVADEARRLWRYRSRRR